MGIKLLIGDERLSLIELKNVYKTFDGTEVIYDFSLSIESGEFATILGPSGCGKSTILKMIGGFEEPTEGQILLNGEDISGVPPYLRSVNTVFQNYALFPHLNVFDNVAFGLKLKNMPKDEITKKVKSVLEVVDLEGFERRHIGTLSGGQQQRIAIARAIINEPSVLLLDEPLSALDYKMRKEMQLELKNMQKELGITFIFVTHDQEEALTMSDKVIVMSDGIIQQVGTPEEIYYRPCNLFVADFIGDCNIFNGIIKGDHRVVFADASFSENADFPQNSKVNAIIRPEHVEICPVDDGQLNAEVTTVDFAGSSYTVFAQSGRYEMEIHTGTRVSVGDKIGLKIDADDIHIIPYDLSINSYDGVLGAFDAEGGLPVSFGDINIFVDYKKVFSDAKILDGRLVGTDGEPIYTDGLAVEVYFSPESGHMSDNLEEGLVTGTIFSFMYMGDHYSYTIRSESEEDYVVADPYLWNSGDMVSVNIPLDSFTIRLKESL